MENQIPRQLNVFPGVDYGTNTRKIGSSNHQLSHDMLPNPWFHQQLFAQPVPAAIEVLQTSQPNFQAEISCLTMNDDHKRKRNYGKADDEGNGKKVKLHDDFVKLYLEPVHEKIRSQEQTIDRLMKLLNYIMRRCLSSNPPDQNTQKYVSEVLELWEENTKLRAALALLREEPTEENNFNDTTPIFPRTFANPGPSFFGWY